MIFTTDVLGTPLVCTFTGTEFSFIYLVTLDNKFFITPLTGDGFASDAFAVSLYMMYSHPVNVIKYPRTTLTFDHTKQLVCGHFTLVYIRLVIQKEH